MRNRSLEGRDHYEIGRHQLALDGAIVRLRVAMPLAVRELFRHA